MKNALNPKTIGLILGPSLFVIAYYLLDPADMSDQARAVMASTLWVAVWWMTECIPIAVTSLLPIVLFPLTGGLDIASTTASFGHRYIFLFVGGFFLAIAIEKWNLHRRIALNVINAIGTSMSTIILGFMIATAFLSMWISNTATSVMMLPIGVAIVAQLQLNKDADPRETQRFAKALMLAIAYSASIGGISTLIGTPPNLVLAGVVQELYGVEISFARWMGFALPLSIFLLFICWRYLVGMAYPMRNKAFPGGRYQILEQLRKMGSITYEERCVLVVFVCTALAWMTRSFLLEKLIPGIDDTMIALLAGFVLFLIPAKVGKGERLLDWESAVRLPWGILLLFGGGLALAEGFQQSGLAEWIGNQLTLLDGLAIVLLLLVLVGAVNFLTEITSNLATTSMILPILAAVAVTVDVHPFVLMFGATLAASCAFMLPVATPPNAVVFGSGYLRIPDMVRTGVILNIVSIVLVTLFAYFMLPLFWGIDLKPFPELFRLELPVING